MGNTFLDNLPQLISQIQAAAEQVESAKVSAYAHKLKGSADNVGGLALRKSAFALEMAGKADNHAEIQRLVKEVEAEYALLAQALKAKLQEIQA